MTLDRLLAEQQLSPALQRYEWVLLSPKNAQYSLPLRAITHIKTGILQSHAWEQTELYHATRNDILLNFCNTGSIIHPRQFVLIHDACVYRHPEFYSKPYVLLHQLLGKLLARNSIIGTVSHFSRSELTALLAPASPIGVFYNGADHLRHITANTTIIERLRLQATPFFLCIGSLTKNKNVRLAVKAFEQLNHASAWLVIVSGGNKTIFGSEELPSANNVIHAGRLSDAEIAGLYAAAQAFIFPSIYVYPSLYEGFGLPPLEAMHHGCPVLATTAPAVQEICGDAASYFDPHNANALAQLMRQTLDGTINRAALAEKHAARVKLFTWEKNAHSIARMIEDQLCV